MSQHMIIAPGEDVDRDWVELSGFAILFPTRAEPVGFLEMTALMPEPKTASFRRYWHPAWKVLLGFFVDDRLDSNIPAGYVMPGWIPGTQLEQCDMEDRPEDL
jgi:hypothetical protein